MKVVSPTPITTGMLVADSVPEAAPAAWSSTTSYAPGDQVSATSSGALYSYQSISDGNRLLYSQQLDNAAWLPANATVTPDAAVAPDGTTTADGIARTAAGGFSLHQAMTVVPGQTYTFSIWLLAGSFAGPMNLTAFFGGGVYSAGTTVTPKSTWARISTTFTVPAGVTRISPYLRAANSVGAVGDSVFAWGAQLEVGSTASAYAPTTSAAQLNVNHPPATSPTWWAIGTILYPEYDPTASYAAGAQVMRAATHRVYESVITANKGNDPAARTDDSKWIDVGPTNRWAMFDQVVGTATTGIGSIALTLAPGTVGALAVLDTNAETVQVQMYVGGTLIYDQTKATNISGGVIDNYYDYFFAPIGKLQTLTFLDLPLFSTAQIVVTITGPDPDGPLNVGTLLVGNVIDLGSTEIGASIGINDYSRKDTDDFGVTTIVPRAWSKPMTLKSMIDTTAVDGIQRNVAALRALPALWIGEDGFDSLTIYGFFKSFQIDLTLANISYVSLTIQGLI